MIEYIFYLGSPDFQPDTDLDKDWRSEVSGAARLEVYEPWAIDLTVATRPVFPFGLDYVDAGLAIVLLIALLLLQ